MRLRLALQDGLLLVDGVAAALAEEEADEVAAVTMGVGATFTAAAVATEAVLDTLMECELDVADALLLGSASEPELSQNVMRRLTCSHRVREC